jgi:hypothetical protein
MSRLPRVSKMPVMPHMIGSGQPGALVGARLRANAIA